MSKRLVALVCGGVLMTATPALAQMQWTDKGFASLSGGIQVGTPDVTTTATFDQYGETATLASTQDVKSGPFFDVQAGYRVWRNLAIGAGYTYVGSKGDATIAGSIPDPIRFDAPRNATASLSDVGHTEQWISALVTWAVPVTDKMDILLSGGPSYVSVSQEYPSGATVTEPTPTLSGITLADESGSGLGFVVGADVRYMITERFGVGALAKFATASVDLDSGTSVDAGGFQIGGGVRIRF